MTKNHPGKDIRQSAEFAAFMEDIGWQAIPFQNRFVYLRRFPFIGNFAKCPRPDPPLSLDGLTQFIKKNRLFRFKISPNLTSGSVKYPEEKKKILEKNFRIDIDPFNPTTSIHIDLAPDEDKIFKSFSEAKRRAVRRALKNEISIMIADDIESFIKIRGRQFYPMGFLIAREMKMLWKNFYPKKADLLLARTKDGNEVAGILLLYHNSIAYYWFASALREGKKLFAPTLLVWEAVKRAKKKGAKILDFEGIYDERFPKASQSWRGFTKFKEGFSSKKVVYMENFYLKI